MNYEYISQLLDKYWECQTTLEEERLLRVFFTQDNIPASLLQYKELFTAEHSEKQEKSLGDDFDQKIKSMLGENGKSKKQARIVSFRQRLAPLFRAAAVVAIVLTIGNAVQVSVSSHMENSNQENVAGFEQTQNPDGTNFAKADSARLDSLHRHITSQNLE